MSRFLIADDHPLFRQALNAALSTDFSDVTFTEAESFDTTVAALRRYRKIDLVLLDLNMPGCENFYGLLRIRHRFPNLPIIVVSASDDVETIAQVMSYGANGFIPKTSATSEMVTAIRSVLKGETWLPPAIAEDVAAMSEQTNDIADKVRTLTPKQFQVLSLVKEGMSNKEIADNLDITEATVKAHISTLFKRLDVKSRTQIVVALEKL